MSVEALWNFLRPALEVAAGTAVAGAAIWKLVLERFLERQRQSFANELSKQLFEHQTRFARAHERRATVIATIYGKLELMDQAFQRLVYDLHENKTGLLADAGRAYMDLGNYYWPRAIWLDEHTCGLLNELMKTFRTLHSDVAIGTDAEGRRLDATVGAEITKALREAIPQARASLQAQFRQHLGTAAPPLPATLTKKVVEKPKPADQG